MNKLTAKTSKTGKQKWIKTEFAIRFEHIMLERDWTLAQMANAVGLRSASSIYKIQNGQKPSRRTLYKITKAFPELAKYAAQGV